MEALLKAVLAVAGAGATLAAVTAGQGDNSPPWPEVRLTEIKAAGH